MLASLQCTALSPPDHNLTKLRYAFFPWKNIVTFLFMLYSIVRETFWPLCVKNQIQYLFSLSSSSWLNFPPIFTSSHCVPTFFITWLNWGQIVYTKLVHTQHGHTRNVRHILFHTHTVRQALLKNKGPIWRFLLNLHPTTTSSEEEEVEVVCAVHAWMTPPDKINVIKTVKVLLDSKFSTCYWFSWVIFMTSQRTSSV